MKYKLLFAVYTLCLVALLFMVTIGFMSADAFKVPMSGLLLLAIILDSGAWYAALKIVKED